MVTFSPRGIAEAGGGYGVRLGRVYAIWALVVIVLYRWVAAVKTRRRDWWLNYV